MTHIDAYLYTGESILLPRKGSLSNIMYVNGPFWTVDTIYWTTVNTHLVNAKYLYYYLSLLDLSSRDTGSALPSMTYNSYYELDIDLPSLSVQQKVAQSIDNIDQKIAINNTISKELESMAKTIYDYWFLQFEFPDKDGKPYKSNGGRMVWNDQLKQKIPEGWKVDKCKKYIKIIRGVSYKPQDKKSERDSNVLPLLKSNNVENGKINFNTPVYLEKALVSPEKLLKGNSVFITMSSGSKSALGKTAVIYDDLPYAFGAFCARVELSSKMQGYLSIIFRSSYFRNYINQITSGTSINNIKNSQLEDLKIIIPNDTILQKFEALIKSFFEEQAILQKEDQQLKSLRDFLLPTLMNGQVTIKD